MLATAELIQEAALPDRLQELLPRWLREVPLYRALAEAAETSVEVAMQRLPLIAKADIRRDFPRNFLRVGDTLDALLDQELVELEHTSGTSEQRTPLLLGFGWWAEQEARALRLNSLAASVLDESPGPRRLTISSPVCSGDISYTGVPSCANRTVGNTLFSSLSRFPFLWGESDLARIAAEAIDWKPRFLDVDPVYGVVFARYCERNGIRLPSLKFIICSYEFVSVNHRRILERAFGVPVFNLYGSTETGHLLMETESGEMRPSLETAYLQVLNVDARGVGELSVTTLTNDFMPLLRYRIGDLVERFEQPYATNYRVHGRAADSFLLPSGERVTTWQIDQCFAQNPGVAHYQLHQREAGEWRLRYVPDQTGPDSLDIAELQSRLTRLLEVDAQHTIESTDLLMPESSGKFRLGYPLKKSPGSRHH
jgi:phenylacetate-CoA ligase